MPVTSMSVAVVMRRPSPAIATIQPATTTSPAITRPTQVFKEGGWGDALDAVAYLDLSLSVVRRAIKSVSLMQAADRDELHQAEQERLRKLAEKKAKRSSRRRPPTPSKPNRSASYTGN
ncbi:MAG: hypothetical protein ABL986_00145 [Vicinamibacterales bacterium]